MNVVGAFVVSRAAARRMVEQGDGGRIVHIASMMSFHAGINTLAYAASKGAIAQLMKAQANEWAPLGIRVNAVAPGWVETELTSAPARGREALRGDLRPASRSAAGRRGEDIAGAVGVPLPARVRVRQRDGRARRRRLARPLGLRSVTDDPSREEAAECR